MRATSRKILTVGAITALASGMVLAGPALAAGGAFEEVSAPATVTAGKTFILDCTMDPQYAGAKVKVREKNAPIRAKRRVASNGDCTFRLVLAAKGPEKLRVVAFEDGERVARSSWIKVLVQ